MEFILTVAAVIAALLTAHAFDWLFYGSKLFSNLEQDINDNQEDQS